MARVLWVTGFGPFPGVSDNPSGDVATRLHGRRIGGFDVFSEVLPTSYTRATNRILQAYARLRPIGALHLGVAKNEKELRIERVAANERTASIPDEDGHVAFGERCTQTYPIDARLKTRLDTVQVAARVRQHGLPARSSDDAGRYVCNSTYFAALHASTHVDPQTLALFVHIPPIGAARAVGGASWRLDDLVLASRVVLVAMADELTGRITGPIA